MSIFAKFKKMLQTPEARHFKEELGEQTREWSTQAKGYAQEAGSKGREYAKQAYSHASEVADDVRDRIQGKIDYDTFKRIEIRVGTIESVEKIEKSDKLLRLMVNVGEEKPRQIISGIAPYFDKPASLQGRQAMFVTNLEPRTIFGYESNGMIFAVNDEESFSILEPDTTITPGTLAS